MHDPSAAQQTPALQTRALDNLDFIRSTMERASSFTAVPGWGNVVMGITALAAAWIAASQTTAPAWLGTWLAEAAVALAIALWAIRRKARSHQIPIFTGPGAKFWRGLVPPFGAGLFLTAGLVVAEQYPLLPGVWLLLYGTGVITGGAHSIRIVAIMGLFFAILGFVALLAPEWGNHLMAAGFGCCHIGFGLVIARRFGG